MGHPDLRPGGAVSTRTATQERCPLRHTTILDLDPAAQDRSMRMPLEETLLGRHRNQLVCPLTQGCIVFEEREQNGADPQGHAPAVSRNDHCAAAVRREDPGDRERMKRPPQALKLGDRHTGADPARIDHRALRRVVTESWAHSAISCWFTVTNLPLNS